MNLSPETKQKLSALLAAVSSSAIVAVEQAVQNTPFTLNTLIRVAAIGAIVGLAHYVKAWGSQEAIVKAVLDGNSSVDATVAKVLDDREPKA